MSQVVENRGSLNSVPLALRVPKKPSRTENTAESEFRYGEKIRYGRSK